MLGVYNSDLEPIEESAIGNHFLFQGRWYSWEIHKATESSGLYYFRARFYDPAQGRFLSKDPIGISGGMNQYRFCANNPVNRRDPNGLWTARVGVFAQAQCIVSVNLNIGIAVGYSQESGLTVGVVGGGLGGLGTPSASVGVFGEGTGAAQVSDLAGGSVQMGGSAGEGIGIGGDYIVGLNDDWSTSYQGGEVNLGLAGNAPLPVEFHVQGGPSFAWATPGRRRPHRRPQRKSGNPDNKGQGKSPIRNPLTRPGALGGLGLR